MDAERYKGAEYGRAVQRPGDKWAFTYYLPNPLPRHLPFDSDTVLLLSDADNSLGHLQGLGRLIPEPDLLVGPFLTREALASSRIEGTNASLTEVLRAEEVGAERSDDVAEVERYLAATRRGLKLIETLPISLRLLKEVHITLMEGVRGEEKQPGEIRWSPVTDRAERKLLQRKFDGPVSGERPHTTDISKPIHHRPSRPDYRWRNRAGRAQPAGPCRRIWLARIYGRSG